MFRAAHRSSSGALNCICSLWFIYKHVEPSKHFGIINSITKLHLVGISTELSTMHVPMNIKFINAKQATDIQAYNNTKRKLYKTNSAIWFNKTCNI